MARPNAKAPLGQGGRFAALVQELMREGKSRDQAEGIAANAGRRSLGKKKFDSLAAKGRKNG
jgi:hypothetical protein